MLACYWAGVFVEHGLFVRLLDCFDCRAGNRGSIGSSISMTFCVLCPDGKDRLRVRWERFADAQFDAKYISNRGTCNTWCPPDTDFTCPGGIHTVQPLSSLDDEPLLAWSV